MPHFREVNTGQVVTHEDDDIVAWFKSQARWVEVDEAPAKKTTTRKTVKKAPAKAAEAPESPEVEASEQ